MCGIVGFLGKQRDDSTVKKMLELQAHRGPDDRGVLVAELAGYHVHLGHNRLSIQDLSIHGHQPFISNCGMYSVAFNGEVYNFKTIRQSLEKLGHTFISTSDTEVVLYAYKEWGIACLEKFIGMFSFSLLDKEKKKLYLVRDRAGIKPLYYYANDKTFLFSSELKSFHAHTKFKKILHTEILPYYFQMGYIPAPHSIYKHTYKLEAGHYIEYDLVKSAYECVQYWSVDACYAQEEFDKSEAEILDDLEVLLEDAVESRMVADVPVGVFLSGGYDSSLVTALVSKKHKGVHTFTIGFKDKKFNEANHAKEIAEYLGTKHTQQYVSSKEMLSQVERLPFYYDEPFGDSSALPMMVVSKLAQRDVKVVLSGDGGDESFCGYSKYFFLHKVSPIFTSKFRKQILLNALNPLSMHLVGTLNSLLPEQIQQTNIYEKQRKLKRALASDTLEEMFLNASSSVPSTAVQAFLNSRQDENVFKAFHINKNKPLLDEMMRMDYKTFMSDDILTKVDRATMSVGLEGRVPLLDHRLIEYLARVPIRLKYKDKQGKYLLRKILYKHIPRTLVDKPKRGFQVPLQSWLCNDLKHLVGKYLDTKRMDGDIFDLQEVIRIKEELFLGNVNEINKVWFMLTYEMWKEKWFD